MLPTTPEMPGAEAGQRVLEALRGDERPKLMLWADSDPVLPSGVGERFASALGAQIDHVIPDAVALPPGGRRRGHRRAHRPLAGLRRRGSVAYEAASG